MKAQMVRVSVPEDDLVSVLVIDDEPSFRMEMKEFWDQQHGCSVQLADTLDKGKLFLDSNAYDIIIADVRFEDSALTGDRFVLQNQEAIGQAKVFVVTAQTKEAVRHFKDLTNRGYNVLEKVDSQFPIALQDAAYEKCKERKSSIEASFAEAARSTVGGAAVAVAYIAGAQAQPEPQLSQSAAAEPGLAPDPLAGLILELKQSLAVWLRARKSPDDPVIAIGSTVLSANELADAIDAGTDPGIAVLRSFVREFKDFSGLNLK